MLDNDTMGEISLAAEERKGDEINHGLSDEEEDVLSQPDEKNIRKTVNNFHERTYTLLHNQMLLSGESASAAWFISSAFKYSGRWLSNKGAVHYGKYGFQTHDFAEAVRLRLLLPPIMDDTQLHQWKCTCGASELIKIPFHLLNCINSQTYQISRHDLIVDLLEKLIKDCSSQSTVVHGGATPSSSFLLTDGKRIVPDLVVQLNQQTVIVDVGVCTPSGASYISEGSDREQGKAAAMLERAKIKKYRKVRGLVESGNFVPFIVEATGRLGDKASNYLALLTETRPDLRNRFIDQLNVVLNHASGQIQFHLRNRLVRSTLS
jgi:hypothetical protein